VNKVLKSSALLISLLLGFAVATPVVGVEVEVHFYGLVAFVEARDATWVLMPDADYNPQNVRDDELPPNMTRADLGSLAPHYAALRFVDNISSVKFGAKYPDIKLPIYIAGMDINSFETSSNPVRKGTLSGPIVKKTTVEHSVYPQKLPADYDVVDKRFLNRPINEWASTIPSLATRIKIERADSITAMPIQCTDSGTPKDILYSFSPNLSTCPGVNQKLAEEVVWKFRTTSDALRFTVTVFNQNGATPIPIKITPMTSAKPVVLHFVNTTDGRDPYDPRSQVLLCDTQMDHLASFRWFERFSLDPSHHRPCKGAGHLGDTKCPLRILEQP
jgi:hypothetical protein